MCFSHLQEFSWSIRTFTHWQTCSCYKSLAFAVYSACMFFFHILAWFILLFYIFLNELSSEHCIMHSPAKVKSLLVPINHSLATSNSPIPFTSDYHQLLSVSIYTFFPLILSPLCFYLRSKLTSADRPSKITQTIIAPLSLSQSVLFSPWPIY